MGVASKANWEPSGDSKGALRVWPFTAGNCFLAVPSAWIDQSVDGVSRFWKMRKPSGWSAPEPPAPPDPPDPGEPGEPGGLVLGAVVGAVVGSFSAAVVVVTRPARPVFEQAAHHPSAATTTNAAVRRCRGVLRRRRLRRCTEPTLRGLSSGLGSAIR